RRHTRWPRDWSSDVCSSDLEVMRPWRSATGGPAIRVRALAALDRSQLPARTAAVPKQGGLSIAYPFQHLTHGKHPLLCLVAVVRSEERRVGKEGRARRGSPY